MTTAQAEQERGERRRERLARQSREQTSAISNIGEIPKVKNPARKAACRRDLKRFLVVYFPRSTGLSPFSPDHDRVIARMQLCVLEGGRHLNAVYRGFAKTSIAEGTAIWAAFYGHRKFVPIFGADAASAQSNIDSIKLELSDNDLLYDDFPEVCHAVRHLEGRPQRCGSQHHKGRPTHIEWSAERIVLPTIARSKASGAVICARGITGGFRGMKFKRPDGTQQRPDFIIGDDLQTDESAASPIQVSKTLSTLRKAVVKLGGHRQQLAIVINATVIEQDDAIDLLLKDPAWQSERIPLVKKWPDAHETLWLERYATLRRTYDKDRPGDQARAWREATQFYADRREEMDRGGEVSWENCFDPEQELSALQHAYNALIDDGAEAFASEYLIRPMPRIQPEPGELKADEVAARVNRCPRGTAPPGSTRLTCFVDVQQNALYYAVCAWKEDFGGALVDWGCWPPQRRAYFAYSDVRPTLGEATGVTSVEGAIYSGLTTLADQLLSHDWPQQHGGSLRIEKLLVDAGWQAEVVRRWGRQTTHAATVLPSKGMPLGAAHVPMSDWPRQPGERRGQGWVLRPPKPGEGRLLLFDANGWKSTLAAKLRQPLGESSAFVLFGTDPAEHRLLCDHLCSEYRVRTFGRGREVEEWKIKVGRPDNHAWDCLVGCCVAASFLGVQPAGMPAAPKRERKKVSYAEAQQRAKAGR